MAAISLKLDVLRTFVKTSRMIGSGPSHSANVPDSCIMFTSGNCENRRDGGMSSLNLLLNSSANLKRLLKISVKFFKDTYSNCSPYLMKENSPAN